MAIAASWLLQCNKSFSAAWPLLQVGSTGQETWEDVVLLSQYELWARRRGQKREEQRGDWDRKEDSLLSIPEEGAINATNIPFLA